MSAAEACPDGVHCSDWPHWSCCWCETPGHPLDERCDDCEPEQ